MILTIILFLLVLSILVVVHEAGHFFAAKKAGIKVEEFGFGLPPRIWGVKKGETIYSINWLPIGGFVKLYGEDEEENAQKHGKIPQDSFSAKPKLVRSAVLLAGVSMNFVLAALIFYTFLGISNFKTEIPLYFDHHFFAVDQTNKTEIVIGSVSKNSPAAKAGVKEFSKVISVNNVQMRSEKDFLDIVNKNKGKSLNLSLQALDSMVLYKVSVTPRVSPPKNEGPLGVAFSPADTAVLTFNTPMQKLFSGVTYSINLLIYNLQVIGKLIGVSFAERTAAPVGSAVSGPVGISFAFDQIIKIPNFKERALQVLNFVGLISISLAFFNVLPFPALDGGRLFFIILEGILGKRVNPKFELWVNQIGMAILLSLFVLITINDILRQFHP